MKFRPVEAELFYGDGQTDTTKLKVAFRNSGIAPKMASTSPCYSSQNAELLNSI